MGVTFLAGTAAPTQNVFNLHAGAATPYDTTNAVTGTDLINAIKARADANPDPLIGAGHICVREIVWTGGSLLKDTNLNSYLADITRQTWADRVYIVIKGQGALIGGVTIRFKNVQLIWNDWKITGLDAGGTRNPFYNTAGGSRHFLFNCKVGAYFQPDTIDWPTFKDNATPLIRLLGGRNDTGASYCHFAGGSVWDGGMTGRAKRA